MYHHKLYFGFKNHFEIYTDTILSEQKLYLCALKNVVFFNIYLHIVEIYLS